MKNGSAHGIQERQIVTKSALLAILGGVVATAAITLNFVFEETGPKEPPANAAISGPDEPPAKSLTLKAEGEPKDIPTRPTFDVVRINPAGDAVMAGRAEPGKVVEIFDGGKKIGEGTSDVEENGCSFLHPLANREADSYPCKFEVPMAQR